MANNVKGGQPNAVVAKVSMSFADAGLTADNCNIIYLIDNPLKSWIPGRPINGITGFVANKGYYGVFKIDMDLTAYVVPPVVEDEELPQLPTITELSAVEFSSTQINLTWNPSSGATAYVLDRATNSGFTTGVSNGIYTGLTRSFADTGRTPGVTYYYRVRATAPGYTASPYAIANAATSAVSYDTDAQPYITAVGATGSEATAISNFVAGAKTAGVWSKIVAFYPLYGGIYSKAKFNLKNASDTDAAYRLTVAQGTIAYTTSGVALTAGVAGDGLDTHITASTSPLAQNSVSIFAHFTGAVGQFSPMGSGSSSGVGMIWSASDSLTMLNNGFDSTGDLAAARSATGRIYLSRTGGTNFAGYKDGVFVSNVTQGSNAPGSEAIYLLNGFGGYNYPFAGVLKMAGIFTGLTGSEITALDALIVTLSTALGK